MRCTGPPCNLGPHCWRDPVGKKHYKLKSHHLRSLIMHLYAEEQQSLEMHQKATRTSTASHPPITITNVLPAPSYQTSHLASLPAGSPAPDMLSKSAQIDPVEDYCTWQKSQVKKPALKVEYQKACDVIKEDGMDLGVKRGIAEHVVGDIDYWVKKYKRAETEE
ncbi:hypothetical protein B0J14DRAFT_621229 [Halenospora varia]|nr:hypothetical protein B0J14DRAFT_621229 [Halenospora varia]